MGFFIFPIYLFNPEDTLFSKKNFWEIFPKFDYLCKMEIPPKIRRRTFEFDRMIRLSADAVYVHGMEKEYFIYLVSRYVTGRVLTNSVGFWDDKDKKIMDEYSPHVKNLYKDVLGNLWEEKTYGNSK